jgi:hypothetical protein
MTKMNTGSGVPVNVRSGSSVTNKPALNMNKTAVSGTNVSSERVIPIPSKDSGKPSLIPVSVYETKLEPLEPLKIKPTPDVPIIAKPAAAPKEDDCGCNKKK